VPSNETDYCSRTASACFSGFSANAFPTVSTTASGVISPSGAAARLPDARRVEGDVERVVDGVENVDDGVGIAHDDHARDDGDVLSDALGDAGDLAVLCL